MQTAHAKSEFNLQSEGPLSPYPSSQVKPIVQIKGCEKSLPQIALLMTAA